MVEPYGISFGTISTATNPHSHEAIVGERNFRSTYGIPTRTAVGHVCLENISFAHQFKPYRYPSVVAPRHISVTVRRIAPHEMRVTRAGITDPQHDFRRRSGRILTHGQSELFLQLTALLLPVVNLGHQFKITGHGRIGKVSLGLLRTVYVASRTGQHKGVPVHGRVFRDSVYHPLFFPDVLLRPSG